MMGNVRVSLKRSYSIFWKSGNNRATLGLCSVKALGGMEFRIASTFPDSNNSERDRGVSVEVSVSSQVISEGLIFQLDCRVPRTYVGAVPPYPVTPIVLPRKSIGL